VIRELIVPFVIGTVSVALMFQANLLIAVFKTYSVSNLRLSAILQLVLYKTPFFLNMTLPVGIALATSLAMSRLVRESELTAMRAAGASILRIMLPISLFGVVVGIGNYFIAESVMPRSEHAATALANKLAALGGAPEFASNITLTVKDYTVKLGNVYRQPDGTLQLNDALLIESPQPYDERVYQAKSGTYDGGLWTFPNASAWDFQDMRLTAFKTKTLTIFEQINITDIYNQPAPTEETAGELLKTIKEAKTQRQNTAMLEVSYWERFSVPAACYVFAIVGPVFAIWLGRGGGFAGVLLSLIMVLLYYNVYVISTEILGRLSWVSPMVAAWLPDVLFLGAAVYGIRRLE
jgi:lipopolysaccharide export system permease protein